MKHLISFLVILTLVIMGCGTVATQTDTPVSPQDAASEASISPDTASDVVTPMPDASDTQVAQDAPLDTPAVDDVVSVDVVDTVGDDASPDDVPVVVDVATIIPDVVAAADVPVAADVVDVAIVPVDVPVVCGTGLTNCGGTCVNLLADPRNCGVCGNVCALASCNGMCAPPCRQSFTPYNHYWYTCFGVCTDFAFDVNNCGTCGHACPAGQGCASGVCV